MSKSQAYFSPSLTRLERALADQLHEKEQPVITLYALFHEIRALYVSGEKLMLREQKPDWDRLKKVRRGLIRADIMIPDNDYSSRVYRIINNGDRAADEICCLVDRFCYISHLSAMARYGLTERRPKSLHLTTPSKRIIPKLKHKIIKQDYGDDLNNLSKNQIVQPISIKHPSKVRKQSVTTHSTSYLGDSLKIRGSFARMASIGQTFVDMLLEPNICGGMDHIIDVWQENADIYIEEIIKSIEKNSSRIVKIRAGYILDEILGIHDKRIEKWKNYAKRGSSRVLDPSKPFSSRYSERWMISINV